MYLDVINLSEEPGVVQILDIHGRVIISENMDGRKLKINVSKMTVGVYFVRFVNDSVSEIRKLVIQ